MVSLNASSIQLVKVVSTEIVIFFFVPDDVVDRNEQTMCHSYNGSLPAATPSDAVEERGEVIGFLTAANTASYLA